MPDSAPQAGRHQRVIAIALAFAAAQLAIVLSGLADGGALCDDAFYYFQIARHAALGRGFSFDGLHPTNGFHPLLAWLSVPVFGVFQSDPWIPIRIVQVILGLATAGTGYVLFRVGRSLDDQRAGELMAVFFFLSPFAWVLPHRGCEGSLSILAIALGAWQMARMARSTVTARDAALLGAAIGLAGLARTENIFWAVAVAPWLFWRTRRAVPLAAFAASAAIVVTPWVIWNLVHFGTIMQVSGAAKVEFRLYHPLPAVKGLKQVHGNLLDVFEHTTRFVVGEEFRPIRWTPLLLKVNAVLLVLAVIAGRLRRMSPVFLPLIALVVFHLSYYAFVQRSYFNWYFLPVVLGAAVVQGERLSRAPKWVTLPLLGASALVCVATLAHFHDRYGCHPHQVEKEVDPVLKKLAKVPEGEHVGGWNVGRIGYFGERRRPDLRFVNLDCVVNNQLFAAWKRGQYTPWVVENVDWLIEQPQGKLDRNVVLKIEGALSLVVADPSDPRAQPPPRPATALVIDDFEDGGYSRWSVTGNAFGDAPARGVRKGQNAIFRFQGKVFINTFSSRGDKDTGRLESQPFTIQRPTLAFLVGGGRDAELLHVSLLVDGERVRSATGEKTEVLERVVWGVPDLIGREAVIEIVDDSEGPWGHILADDFYQD